jgi:hypothetical protein
MPWHLDRDTTLLPQLTGVESLKASRVARVGLPLVAHSADRLKDQC